jgi:hypothetical protein
MDRWTEDATLYVSLKYRIISICYNQNMLCNDTESIYPSSLGIADND